MIDIFRNVFAPPRHMILLVLAAWIGLSLAEKHAERYELSKEDINNLAFYGLIAFVIGGRISFVLQNIPTFTKSPLSVFSVNPDLFDLLGGLIIACITALIYGQRRGLSLWPTLDALTPFFAVLAIGLGLSHLAAGTAFGAPTDVAWGIELWNARRHPSQVYETLASLLTFSLLWLKRPNSRPGLDFLTFAALTAGWNVFLQAFRGDSALTANGLRQSQIVALALLAICFVLLEIRMAARAARNAVSETND